MTRQVNRTQRPFQLKYLYSREATPRASYAQYNLITPRTLQFSRTRKCSKQRDLLCSLILLRAPSSAAAAPDAQSKRSNESKSNSQKQNDEACASP